MTATNAGTILQANLQRVFNERDVRRRRESIEQLYAADAVLYEPQALFAGTEAIAGAIGHLLGSLPPDLRFAAVAPPMQNHAMGKLLWRGVLPDGTTLVTGTDVVRVEAGQIQSIHVFVDAPP